MGRTFDQLNRRAISDLEFCHEEMPERIPMRFRPEVYQLWCIELPGHAGPHRAVYGDRDWNASVYWLDPE